VDPNPAKLSDAEWLEKLPKPRSADSTSSDPKESATIAKFHVHVCGVPRHGVMQFQFRALEDRVINLIVIAMT